MKIIDPEKQFNSWMRNILRCAFFKWHERTLALQAARIERGRYKCASCGTLFGVKEIRVDHIFAVVEPSKGFIDWNTYIARLFCPASGLQILCKPCHQVKTNQEREQRKLHGTAQFSIAARQRMSEIRKGHHDNLGVPKSLVTRQKMSKERKGKPQTLARAAVLKKVHIQNQRAVIGVCIATGIVHEFSSIKRAADHLNIFSGNISRVCNRTQGRTQIGGFTFRYKE